MSLIEYDILKKALLSIHIEESYIPKMISKSSYFSGSKSRIVSYTFPLYTSFKKIDDIFSFTDRPEESLNKIKPVSITIDFCQLAVDNVKMLYNAFETTFLIDIDYYKKSALLLKIPKLKNERLINACWALDHLNVQLGIDKNICKMIKRNQFIDGSFGCFTVCSSKNKLIIRSDNPSRSCIIPDSIFKIFYNKPDSLLLNFSSDYIFQHVSFTDERIARFNNTIHIIDTSLNVNIDGQLTSYVENIYDFNTKKLFSTIEIKINDLPLDDILTLVNIKQKPELFKEILPESYICGPSNIPNLNDRLLMAKMISFQ